jgi:hypothetical protein
VTPPTLDEIALAALASRPGDTPYQALYRTAFLIIVRTPPRPQAVREPFGHAVEQAHRMDAALRTACRATGVPFEPHAQFGPPEYKDAQDRLLEAIEEIDRIRARRAAARAPVPSPRELRPQRLLSR